MKATATPRVPALLASERRPARVFPEWPICDQTDEARVLRALRSGRWGKLAGTEVREFERRFAAMHGARHGIAVVNGTVSLRLALIACGLRQGEEVIVPAYTFLATAAAVVEANAVPTFVDVDLDTFNMSPAAFAAAITPRTRAVIVVHLAGMPADMEAILAIARKHRLKVIEDAAHAHAATYRGKPVGSLGDIASFSFQLSKNLTAGEGGILTTNDETLAAACESLHNCGRVKDGPWYSHHFVSGNYRLGELQGALLNTQLDRLERQTERRDENGRYLAERLAKIPGIIPQKRTAECTRHAYHLFAFRVDPAVFGLPRAFVLRALAAEGVAASTGYPLPLYWQPGFLHKAFGPYLQSEAARLDYSKISCPNTETLCYHQGAWYSQWTLLGSRADLDAIAEAFELIYTHRRELAEWAKAEK